MDITALIAAYNEEDIIGPVLTHLTGQGIAVYLIDHGSTDGTVEEASRFLGRGLLRVERFPEESGFPPELAGKFAWQAILERKQALANELGSDWFIHHDADELRESPWPEQTLREGIETADRLGYSAIDFQVFNFQPTRDGFGRGDELDAFFTHYEPGEHFDKWQVKCWKRQPAEVDLASLGGHDVQFPGRRVCPVRFILRHYPIRSQAHGERKIFAERRPRFVAAERARGWHVQYDAIEPAHRFIADEAKLRRFDLDEVRAQVMVRHRSQELLEQAERSMAAYEAEEKRLSAENDELRAELDRRFTATEGLEREVERLAREVAGRERLFELVSADSDARAREVEAMRADTLARARELEELRADSQARVREVEELRADGEARVEQLRADGEARASELERLVAAERAAAEAAHALTEVARVELEGLRVELAGLRAEHAAARAALEQSRRAAAESASALADAARRVAELETTRARVEEAERGVAELARLRAELNAAEARLDDIYGSRTWRWSASARMAWKLIGRQ